MIRAFRDTWELEVHSYLTYLMKYHELYIAEEAGEGTQYTWLELADGTRRKMTYDEKRTAKNYPVGAKVFQLTALSSTVCTQTCMYDFELDGKIYKCGKKAGQLTAKGCRDS